MAGKEFEADSSFEHAPLDGAQEATRRVAHPDLPIYSILDSVDFSDHFVIIGDVGTGKSTVTPIREFEKSGRSKKILIREPSRASCSALLYSLAALHPEMKGELAVITKDTKINVGGKITIVTDGVLLRMLAEESVADCSIYFDESHQMSSQLELCMSLARRDAGRSRNLLRVMSATIDPKEFLSFLRIPRLYTLAGRRYPVRIDVKLARDVDDMFDNLALRLGTQRREESWLVFLPTRRLVEKYAANYDGVFIHGGLEGSEINRIQKRAEQEKSLRIFATNVIASSVNIYVDNVLVFNETIDAKDRLGQKTLRYRKLDNNSLLQMIGRIGRFKPGRAVIISDTPIPRKIGPTPVRKDMETETPFDLVLLMSRYGLGLSQLEFMSKVDPHEVAFAENWLAGIGAIDRRTHTITQKGLLMSEIPYEPDFAHMISSALISDDYQMAGFLLASGAFGDSLNHAYRSDREGAATEFLYGFDRSNELNIKAHLLKRYSEDAEGAFASRLTANGIFIRFVDEARKNFESAIGGLNDVLRSQKRKPVTNEVLVDPDPMALEAYLEDCLSFERHGLHEARKYNLRHVTIEGRFYARSVTMNFREILFDIVGLRESGHRRGSSR